MTKFHVKPIILAVGLSILLSGCNKIGSAASNVIVDAHHIEVKEYNQGVNLLQQGEVAKAIPFLLKAAEAGNVDAQYNLSIIYHKGEEVPRDLDKSFMWASKAAEQGDSDAQYNLGLYYSLGDGTKVDMKESTKWLTKSAEQGDSDAQLNLGVRYRDGTGVSKDLAQATKWLKASAVQKESSSEEARMDLQIICLDYEDACIEDK